MIRTSGTRNIDDVRPVYVPSNGTRSYTMEVVFINGQGKYQHVAGYWDDVLKRWEYASSGLPIEFEVVRTEPLPETIIHYDE